MSLVEMSYDAPVETLDAVAAAISKASCPDRQGPFGLFDYSSYGDEEPHRVRDFRDPGSPTWGMTVHRGSDRDEALRVFEELTRRHVAAAAFGAMTAAGHEAG